MVKETRNEKFRRIAETRMSRIFVNMDLIANLTNKQRYDYTEEEIEEIFEAYQSKGKEIQQYFGDEPISEKPNEENFIFSTNIKINSKKNNDFRRIAENRMSRVFKDMNLIANLSTKTNYTYSNQEINELFNAYYEKGVGVKERFFPRGEFKFSDK